MSIYVLYTCPDFVMFCNECVQRECKSADFLCGLCELLRVVWNFFVKFVKLRFGAKRKLNLANKITN